MYKAVIVDDEPMILEGIKKALNWEGYYLEISLATTNPLEVLSHLRKSPADLLITDVSMPTLNGLELIRQAKQCNPLISVLVLSAYDNFDYVRTALRYGAENYLLKPLDPDELSESISQLISHMQEREQISSTYSVNMLTFRSNFVENWVKNRLNVNELKTRSAFLGINIDKTLFQVAIFTAKDNRPETMSYFFDYLLNHLLGRISGNFYFETPTRLVCVLSKVTTSSPCITDFIKKTAQEATYPIFCAIGQQVASFNSVCTSYQNAVGMLWFQYSKAICCIYPHMDIYPPQLHLIRQSFKNVSQTDYINTIGQLIHSSTPSRTIQLIYLEVIRWASMELNKPLDTLVIKCPTLIKILETAPIHVQNTDMLLNFMGRFLTEIFNLVTAASKDTYPIVDLAIEAIQGFSDKDISLKTLANRMNVTPSYLGTLFKQQTGYYFNDYMTQARLNYATQLLQESDYIVKDIVDQVGFSSQAYFNRIFKRHYNMSPVAYRRQSRMGHNPTPNHAS